MPTDPRDPGPTKDSNYSQKFLRGGTYADAARSTSASAQRSRVTSVFPYWSEFNGDAGSEPDDEIYTLYERFIKHSEFKKPYLPGNYREMEGDSDPPPGGPRRPNIDAPPGTIDPTATIDPNDPTTYTPGGTVIVFNAWVDTTYDPSPFPGGEGGYCRGTTTWVRIKTTEPWYRVDLTYGEDDTVVTGYRGDDNTCLLEIQAGNDEFHYIRVRVNMQSVEGVTGSHEFKIEEVVCAEYLHLYTTDGLTSMIYDMTNDQIASNINDNAGAAWSNPGPTADISNFLSNIAPYNTYSFCTYATAGWETDIFSNVLRSPPFYKWGPCTADPWTGTDTVGPSAAPGSGVGDCGSFTGMDYYDDWWGYSISENSGPCSLADEPMTESFNSLFEGEEQGGSFSATLTGTAEGAVALGTGGIGIIHTKHYQYTDSSYYEWADYTGYEPGPPPPGAPPYNPPADEGFGYYNGTMDHLNSYYCFLNSSPFLEIPHDALIAESWNKTFRMNGTVAGFTRAFAAEGQPRSNYDKASGYNKWLSQFDGYAAHSAFFFVMIECMHISATADTTGTIGPYLLSDWEAHEAVTPYIVDEEAYFGVQAGIYYDDEFARLQGICDLTRSSNLESAVEDWYKAWKSAAGYADWQVPEYTAVDYTGYIFQ